MKTLPYLIVNDMSVEKLEPLLSQQASHPTRLAPFVDRSPDFGVGERNDTVNVGQRVG